MLPPLLKTFLTRGTGGRDWWMFPMWTTLLGSSEFNFSLIAVLIVLFVLDPHPQHRTVDINANVGFTSWCIMLVLWHKSLIRALKFLSIWLQLFLCLTHWPWVHWFHFHVHCQVCSLSVVLHIICLTELPGHHQQAAQASPRRTPPQHHPSQWAQCSQTGIGLGIFKKIFDIDTIKISWLRYQFQNTLFNTKFMKSV